MSAASHQWCLRSAVTFSYKSTWCTALLFRIPWIFYLKNFHHLNSSDFRKRCPVISCRKATCHLWPETQPKLPSSQMRLCHAVILISELNADRLGSITINVLGNSKVFGAGMTIFFTCSYRPKTNSGGLQVLLLWKQNRYTQKCVLNCFGGRWKAMGNSQRCL